MNVGEIVKYGLFNSKKDYHNVKITPNRTVRDFEFDYILSCDKQAMSYLDEQSCLLAPNILILRKPKQQCHSRLHFACYCLHIHIEPDNPLYNKLYSAPNFFTFINEKTYQPLLEELFKHLIKSPNAEHDLFTCAKILELVYHLKKDEKHNKHVKQTIEKHENSSIQKVVSYLKQNYQEEISLKKLGELTGYSPNHLQRIFTDFIGESPLSYLENVRINQAKFLLSKEENTLADIAYTCGFSSQSYFSKIFKKHTLLTPYEFRKKSAFKYDELQ